MGDLERQMEKGAFREVGQALQIGLCSTAKNQVKNDSEAKPTLGGDKQCG